MTMCQITMKIPNEVLLDIHMNDREADAYAKQVFVLWLYTKNKVSIGYCAEIAEMLEDEFTAFSEPREFPPSATTAKRSS